MGIQSFEPSTSIDELTRTLRRDGVLIVDELIEPDIMEEYRQIFDELIESRPIDGSEFFGGRQRAMGALFNRDPRFSDLMLNPVVTGL